MSLDLPESGADDFLPLLIDTLSQHPALDNWQFDETIFWLILLALVIRKGGVIIDVPESQDRKRHFTSVVDSTRSIAESIFGLDTRCIHLNNSTPPEDLRQLVLDRRKRTLRDLNTPVASNAPSAPPSPMVPGSGMSTRYHSAESVLPASPLHTPLASPTVSEPHQSEHDWPEVLVVSGLEDCDSPTQNKLRELVKSSGKDRVDGRETLMIWVRREEQSARVPSWLADQFLVSSDLYAEEVEPPPRLHRQCLLPQSYIDDLSALLPYTHIHPPLTQQLNNLITATSTHPNLQSTLTGRFFITLPTLVRASRLLIGGFALPPTWQDNLALLNRPDQGEMHRFGLGGGTGGVNGWARKAGEEPNLAELGEGGEAWFAESRDVKAIWRTAVRHRVKWRGLSESVMWNLKTDAAGLVREEEVSRSKTRKRAQRQREEVDKILEDMIDML